MTDLPFVVGPSIEIAPNVYATHTESMQAIERTVNSRSSWDDWRKANRRWKTLLWSQFTEDEIAWLIALGIDE